jgi:phosphoketolase
MVDECRHREPGRTTSSNSGGAGGSAATPAWWVTVQAGSHTAGHRAQPEEWLRSYRPEELFDADGALRPELRAGAPTGQRRMSANPHANGGLLLRDLDLSTTWTGSTLSSTSSTASTGWPPAPLYYVSGC